MGLFGGGEDPKQPVTDYFAAIHYGVCAGPVDDLREVWYGEKRVWSGSIASNQALTISKPGLFGGEKVEGGLTGRLEVLLGASGQLLPQAAVDSLVRNGAASDASPLRNPGFRGLFSVFLHGGGLNRRAGANIGSNTASIKAFWFKIRRAPKGCPFDPTIVVNDMHLANPAGIIWECLTDADWGMGTSASMLDTASFSAAAATLNSERFGLFLLWQQQESIEDFISAVLDHIEATLALDPFTGRLRLKLIRGDYDPDTLPVFGPHNATLSGFSRKAWGETINEVSVSWTNPVNEQAETVTVHDTANISLQGGSIVSETRDYSGIRTADLALRVATRDLQTASSSLASAELRVNRQAWRVLPGDVIALTWPDYGIASLPMRVGNVDYGKPGDSMITLSVVEDVFGMPEQAYVSSDGSTWVDPAIEPAPLTQQVVTSAPYYVVAQKGGEALAESASATSDYDIAFGTHPASGVFSYELMTQQADANGTLQWVNRGTYSPAARGVLSADLAQETLSVIADLDDLARGMHATTGALVWIGPNDASAELALVKSVDGSGYTLLRGALDTVPKAWPVGTPVWFLPETTLGSTGIERTAGETTTVRFRTTTALGTLDTAAAPDVSKAMTGRLHRPYRPANVAVNGVLWPDPDTSQTYPATVTWAGRNRLEETTLITRWDEAPVTPEPGVTYEVRLSAEDNAGVLTSDYLVVDVGTATSYTLDPLANIPPAGTTHIRLSVWALRAGLRSWQAVEHRLPVLSAPEALTYSVTSLSAPDNPVATPV